MIYFLFAVVIITVSCFAIAGVMNVVSNRSGVKRAEFSAAKAQRTIGEKALRSIANGPEHGPALEAQIALDEISRLYDTKELS